MKQLGFVFNGARCNGCAACVIACKEEKQLPDGVWLRRRVENPSTMSFLTLGCNHCDDPACLKVCPVKAYHKEANGLVIQDHNKCIGCQACVGACPYHVPSFAKSEKKVYKCDACQARLAKGEVPACVASCPMGAIEFGAIDELRVKYPEAVEQGMVWAAKEFHFPSPQLTHPNLVIVPLSSGE